MARSKMPAPRLAVEFSRPVRSITSGRPAPLKQFKPVRTPAAPTPLEWESVPSDTIARFAYVPEYRDLLVTFKSGGMYVYRDVEPGLVAQLRKPHPWRKVGLVVKEHKFEHLASIRTKPLKKRTKKVETS